MPITTLALFFSIVSIVSIVSTALGGLPGVAVPAPWASGPQFDCNGNGIEDAVDIAFGTSSDVDQNGVPDECEVG